MRRRIDEVPCLWRDLVLLKLGLRRISLVVLHASLSFLRIRLRSLHVGQSMVVADWYTTLVRYGLRAVVDCTHLAVRLRLKAAPRAVSNLVDSVMLGNRESLVKPR